MADKLNREEQSLLKSFEKGEWVPVADLPEREKKLVEYARSSLRKDRRLNIRISEHDLVELQRKAVEEGLPYQTYVASIIHKFLNGSLARAVEAPSSRQLVNVKETQAKYKPFRAVRRGQSNKGHRSSPKANS